MIEQLLAVFYWKSCDFKNDGTEAIFHASKMMLAFSKVELSLACKGFWTPDTNRVSSQL